MIKDYYKELGLSPDCSQEEIKKAYRKLARDFHPDMCGNKDSTKFRSIQEAYETLGKTEKRKLYDQQLKREQFRHAHQVPTYSIRLDDEEFYFPLSLENWFNQILDNIFQIDFHAPIFADIDNQLELILTKDEAAAGGVFAIKVPIRHICPVCQGKGGYLLFFCDACQGHGQILKDFTINLKIPPAIKNHSHFSIPIDNHGFLDITVIIQ